MNDRVFHACIFGIALLVGGGCATGAAPPPRARIADSAPEKVAAQRRAARLDLEADDQRWGIDAARERERRRTDDRKTAAAPGGGSTDLTNGAAARGGEPADVPFCRPEPHCGADRR